MHPPLLRRFLPRPESDPDFVVAQARALSRQVPVLHAILSVDAIAVAYTHHGIAPDYLTVLPLTVLLGACAIRVLYALRIRNRPLSPAQAVRRLRGTNRLAVLLGTAFAAWAMLLTGYGDVGTQMHVLFFLTITMIACISCLIHVRSAALIVVAIAIPLSIYFMLGESVVLRVTALNFACVLVVLLFMHTIVFRDFRRLDALIRENSALAHTDTLTALPNRRSFFARLQETIEAGRVSGERFSIAVIDLDGFKPVNDSFGHHAGDAVLREVARRLMQALAGGGWAARLGGDEFGLILDRDADLDALGKALCAALAEPYALREVTARIGASIGFARFPENAEDGDLLVERADYALYSAKAAARGTAICFTQEHEDRLRRQAVIEQALRHADLAEELTLVFQPIVDLAEGRVAAYEALARWNSPAVGFVSPADFIPVAERTGLIQDLSRVLLGKALAAMRTWPEAVGLSFNLSAQDIASPEGIERITALVVQSGITPSRIVFEVTETGLMRDLVDAGRSLGTLKALGVGIALDDFGTGYSSLGYVHRLPVSELKIDRSFVTDICTDAASLNIVRSIMDLCRHLRVDCVVEGVETEEQMLLLRAAGCRLMQGYLFHRPMPEADIAGFQARPLAIEAPTARMAAA